MQLGQFNKQTLDSICRGCFHKSDTCPKRTMAANKGFCNSYYKSGSIYKSAVESAMANHGLYR